MLATFAAYHLYHLVHVLLNRCVLFHTWQAHSHFCGVNPAHRGQGIGRLLYQEFFAIAKARGCTVVHAVTHPSNTASVAFHRKLGFVPRPTEEPVASAAVGVGSSRKEVVKEGGHVVSPLEECAGSSGVTPSSIVHVDWDGCTHDRVLLDKLL